MIYTILILIVFIAELIIVQSIIRTLLSLNSKIIKLNNYFVSKQEIIKEICTLSRKISEQTIELSITYKKKFSDITEKFVLQLLNKILITILLIRFNTKMVKKFRRSLFGKIVVKGFSLLQNMV
ncbi:MAG: hypothetical protein MJ237_04725 [bacterium]|nr:hypothetical protein [bacterium]